MNQELLASVKDVFVTELEGLKQMCLALSEDSPDVDVGELAEKFSALRGTFSLLVMPGAESLAAELSDALHNPSVLSEKRDALLTATAKAATILSNYFLLAVSEGQETPLLLAPELNAIRALQGKPILDDSAFLRAHLPEKPFVFSVTPKSDQQKQVFARSRQLYQKGLLHLIRGQAAQPSLRVMLHSVALMAKSMRADREQLYWQLAAATIEAIALRKLALTKSRVRLLMVLERQMAVLAKSAETNALKLYPAGNQRSLLGCLMLLNKVSDRDQRLAYQLGVDVHRYSDQEIKVSRAQLNPQQNTSYTDNLMVLEDSLRDLRILLDEEHLATDPSASEADVMKGVLQKLAQTSGEMGLSQPHANFSRHLQQLDSQGLSGALLQSVVDSVLHLDCVLLQLDGQAPNEKQLRRINEQSPQVLIEKNISANAQRLALEGAVQALTDIMQVISDYASELVDPSALLDLRSKFDVVIGVTGVLHLDRAKAVAQRCKQLLAGSLEQNLVSRDVFMDTLADALASLEFYLSSCSRIANADEDVLKLAEECLQLVESCSP